MTTGSIHKPICSRLQAPCKKLGLILPEEIKQEFVIDFDARKHPVRLAKQPATISETAAIAARFPGVIRSERLLQRDRGTKINNNIIVH